MFKKIFSVMVMMIMFSLVFSSTSFADVELEDGVTTGMTVSEVRSSPRIKLKFYKKMRNLDIYRETELAIFYAFSECTGKLIYKITLVKNDTANDIEAGLFDENFTKIKGSRAYTYKKDVGIKFVPLGKKDITNIWTGSISRWNNFAMGCGDSTKLFPKNNGSIN